MAEKLLFILNNLNKLSTEPFQKMKDELLKFDDYNVILLDWGGGSAIPYTQATANTRVVGAELAKLIRVLQVVLFKKVLSKNI